MQNKFTQLGVVAVIAAGMAFVYGWNKGSSYEQEKYTVISASQQISNAQSVGRNNAALAAESVHIVYKTKYIKEYIHAKESSIIDTDVNAYWVQLMDSAAAVAFESVSPPNESGAAVKISRITGSVTDNYINCNYDKERLRQFQQFARDNGFEIDSESD